MGLGLVNAIMMAGDQAEEGMTQIQKQIQKFGSKMLYSLFTVNIFWRYILRSTVGLL